MSLDDDENLILQNEKTLRAAGVSKFVKLAKTESESAVGNVNTENQRSLQQLVRLQRVIGRGRGAV